MEENKKFYTLKGYELQEKKIMTPAMEDYIEMIYRISIQKDYVRINEIAGMLNVKASSATKMVNNLKFYGFVNNERYSYITLTAKGTELGKYYLKRHTLLNELLCFINKSDNELEEVEKIEHFLSKRTITNIESFLSEQKK